MKKVLLMNVLYKPNIGGVETSIAEITNALYEAGYQTDIFCSDRNNESSVVLNLFEDNEKHNIYRYNYTFGKFSILKNILNSRKTLRIIKKENDYNFVVSRSYFLIIISWLSGIKNISYIVPEVIYYSNKGNKLDFSIMRLISKTVKVSVQLIAFLIAKDVFVFSEGMIEQVKRSTLGLVSPKIIEPGVNFKKFSIPTIVEKNCLRDLYSIQKNKKVLLALGRFSEIKQFDLIILAMAFLPKDYLLLLVGSGPELKNYQDLISENGLENKILLFDSTNNPEHFYKISDIFLMTSRYESFGQTILEAAMSGLQIVAFNRKSGVNTNIEDMLSGCKGTHLVSVQSSEVLAKVIISVFKNTEIKNADFVENQIIIKKRYSWNKLVSEMGIDN